MYVRWGAFFALLLGVTAQYLECLQVPSSETNNEILSGLGASDHQDYMFDDDPSIATTTMTVLESSPDQPTTPIADLPTDASPSIADHSASDTVSSRSSTVGTPEMPDIVKSSQKQGRTKTTEQVMPPSTVQGPSTIVHTDVQATPSSATSITTTEGKRSSFSLSTLVSSGKTTATSFTKETPTDEKTAASTDGKASTTVQAQTDRAIASTESTLALTTKSTRTTTSPTSTTAHGKPTTTTKTAEKWTTTTTPSRTATKADQKTSKQVAGGSTDGLKTGESTTGLKSTASPKSTTTSSSTVSPSTQNEKLSSSKSTRAATGKDKETEMTTEVVREKTTTGTYGKETSKRSKSTSGKATRTEGPTTETTENPEGSSATTGTTQESTTTIDPYCRMHGCPKNWTRVENRCFYLTTTAQRPRYSYNEALCKTLGGNIITVQELMTPSYRSALRDMGLEAFNTTLFFSNAFDNRFLREENDLRVFNLSAPIEHWYYDIFGKTSMVMKRRAQKIDTSILSICQKNAFCTRPECPVFELVAVNGDKLRTDHLDPRQYAAVGTKMDLKCFELNSEKVDWSFECGSRGQWIPHPSFSRCDRIWGKTRTVEPHGTYQRTMKSVHDCFVPGTHEAMRFENGTYQCLCNKGFEGFRCELYPLSCEQFAIGSDPCSPHGKCENEFETWHCACRNESRTGPRCEFDRFNRSQTLFWDSQKATVFSLAAFSCVPSVLSVFLKQIVDFIVPFAGTRLNDRQAVFANARLYASAARCLVAGLFGHPQTFPVYAQRTWGADVWLMFHFASIVVLMLHCVETHIGLDILNGRHWNTMFDRNGRLAWTAVFCYLLAPFAAVGAWAFYMIRDDRPSLYTYLSPWSNLGRAGSMAYFDQTQVIYGFGAIIVLIVTMYGYGDHFQKSNPHGLHRIKAVFAHYRPGRTEPFNKVLRCRVLNTVATHLAFLHYILLMVCYDQPHKFHLQVWCFIAGCGYTIVSSIQIMIVSKPEVWRRVIVRLMFILPKRFSPTHDPISCWSREEILHKLRPEMLAKEKAAEKKERETEEKAEMDSRIKKRADWIAQWPDCPAHLLPHVPEEACPLKYSVHLPWRFASSVKRYVCELKRNSILLDMAMGYMKDRIWNKHNVAASAWRGCSKYIHRRHDYNAPDSEDIQIWWLYKEIEHRAAHNDTLTMGRDKQTMTSRQNWDIQYYADMEGFLKKLPHHDPRPRMFRPYWETMEKSMDAWRLLYSVENPPVVGYPRRTFMGTRNDPLHPPLAILTKEMFEEKIQDWKFMIENNSKRWDAIYSTDFFIEKMTLAERLQFERLQTVIQVTPESGQNPRDGELKDESAIWWDHRRPGFIGPRARMTRPTFFLWQLSHEREFMEEMEQNEFRRKNDEVEQMTRRRGTDLESRIDTVMEFFLGHWPRKCYEPYPWRPERPIYDTPY